MPHRSSHRGAAAGGGGPELLRRLHHPRWETDSADPDRVDEEGKVVQPGFRQCRHSKDHRSDLPPVLIVMSVPKEGGPIRVGSRPGRTGESRLIRQVRDDL